MIRLKYKRVLKYSGLGLCLLLSCTALTYQIYASCKCKRESQNIIIEANKHIKGIIDAKGSSVSVYLTEFNRWIDVLDVQIKDYENTKTFRTTGSDSVKTDILLTQKVITILKDSLMANINREIFSTVGG